MNHRSIFIFDDFYMAKRRFLPTVRRSLAIAALIHITTAAAGDLPSHDNSLDACSFLSQAEVDDALGSHALRGELHDDGEVRSGSYAMPGAHSATCLWRQSGGAERGAGYVILNMIQWPQGRHGAKRFLQSFRDASQRGEISQKPVALGIADEALWWGDGVAVRRGDRSFGVSVHFAEPNSRQRETAEVLARAIASRL